MVDQKTAYLELPLPHHDNTIDEDCPRLRGALTQIDGHAEQTDQALHQHDAALSTLSEQNALIGRRQDSLERQTEQNKEDIAANVPRPSTPDKLGMVRIGEGVDVTEEGVISVEIPEVPLAGPERAGLVRPDRDTISLDEAGNISADHLPPTRDDTANSYQSSGTATATGFKLADSTDLATIFGKLDVSENLSSGSGAFLKDAALSVDGKTVKLSRTYGQATYCAYCSYCTYCRYCECYSNNN